MSLTLVETLRHRHTEPEPQAVVDALTQELLAFRQNLSATLPPDWLTWVRSVSHSPLWAQFFQDECDMTLEDDAILQAAWQPPAAVTARLASGRVWAALFQASLDPEPDASPEVRQAWAALPGHLVRHDHRVCPEEVMARLLVLWGRAPGGIEEAFLTLLTGLPPRGWPQVRWPWPCHWDPVSLFYERCLGQSDGDTTRDRDLWFLRGWAAARR